MPNISDLGKRIHRRAPLAVFACKTAQKFRQPRCGRLTLLLASRPLPRKPPSRARARSLRFARSALAQFSPPESLALSSSAQPRHFLHSYIRSNPLFVVLLSSSGFVARCPGWSAWPVHRAGFSSSNSACRVGPFRSSLLPGAQLLPSWPRPSRCSPFPNPHPLRSFVCPNPPPVKLAPFIRTPSFSRLRSLESRCRPYRRIPSEYRMRCSARIRAGCPAESHRAWEGAVSACDARQWRQRRVRSGPGHRPAAYGAR